MLDRVFPLRDSAETIVFIERMITLFVLLQLGKMKAVRARLRRRSWLSSFAKKARGSGLLGLPGVPFLAGLLDERGEVFKETKDVEEIKAETHELSDCQPDVAIGAQEKIAIPVN